MHPHVPTDPRVQAIHAYFWRRYEDPTVIAKEFFTYWIDKGKTAAQIFQIATNQRES
jgi:hypothetical protein